VRNMIHLEVQSENDCRQRELEIAIGAPPGAVVGTARNAHTDKQFRCGAWQRDLLATVS